MFINSVRAEWQKLTSTKSFWWTTGLIVGFAVLFAIIINRNLQDTPFGPPEVTADLAVAGLKSFSFLVFVIQAIMVVTSEYRHNLQVTTFLATPKRTVVMLAKLFLYSVFTALVTFLTILLCFYLAKAVAPGDAGAALDVWKDDAARRLMWVLPLTNVLLVVFSQGISWLLRHTAGVVSLMMIWLTTLEPLASLIPKVGDKIRNYGPVTNMNAFLDNNKIEDLPWEVTGSGLYFAAWAFGFFILGMIALNKRDV